MNPEMKAINVFCEVIVTWPLTFGHQILIHSSLSYSAHVYQILRNFLSVLLSVHKNGEKELSGWEKSWWLCKSYFHLTVIEFIQYI